MLLFPQISSRPRPRVVGKQVNGKCVALNLVIGCILSHVRQCESTRDGEHLKSQSDWSEKMGFHPRLLSKYESGSVNLSIANLSYISSYLDLELYVFQDVLREIVYFLSQNNIYVFIDIDNLPITNEDFNKNTLEDLKFICLYKWLNLDIEFSIDNKIQFNCNESINIYDLRKYLTIFFDKKSIDYYRLEYRQTMISNLLKRIKEKIFPDLISEKTTAIEFDKIRKAYNDFRKIISNNLNQSKSRYFEKRFDSKSYNIPPYAEDISDIEDGESD